MGSFKLQHWDTDGMNGGVNPFPRKNITLTNLALKLFNKWNLLNGLGEIKNQKGTTMISFLLGHDCHRCEKSKNEDKK